MDSGPDSLFQTGIEFRLEAFHLPLGKGNMHILTYKKGILALANLVVPSPML